MYKRPGLGWENRPKSDKTMTERGFMKAVEVESAIVRIHKNCVLNSREYSHRPFKIQISNSDTLDQLGMRRLYTDLYPLKFLHRLLKKNFLY